MHTAERQLNSLTEGDETEVADLLPARVQVRQHLAECVVSVQEIDHLIDGRVVLNLIRVGNTAKQDRNSARNVNKNEVNEMWFI